MIYFREPRLSFSAAGSIGYRIASYATYAGLAISSILLIISETRQAQAVGVLLSLFLVDRALGWGRGDGSIYELHGDRINIAKALTAPTFRVLERAVRKSRALKKNFYLVMLEELLTRRDVRTALLRLDVDIHAFEAKIDASMRAAPEAPASREEVLRSVEVLSALAFQNAIHAEEGHLHSRNYLAALASIGDPSIAKIFELFDINATNLEEAIIFGRYRRKFFHGLPSVVGGFFHRGASRAPKRINRAWTSRPTPLLDTFSDDITELADVGRAGFLVGHDREYRALLEAVSRPGRPNAVLVGESGSGKGSIIAHLAFRMMNDDVPPVLFDKRLVSLRIADLLADATPEALIARLKGVAQEVSSAGNVVLHIADMHNLFRTGSEHSLSAIDVLLPIIKGSATPFIGETFPKEFKQYIEPRTDFLQQFEVVRVEEISEDSAIRYLIYSSIIFERQYRVFISFRAIEKAVRVAHKYFHEKLLPGSAERLLERAVLAATRSKRRVISAEDIIAVAETETKIPIEQAGEAEAEKLLKLEEIIHEKLVNQETAVSSVSRALREYRSGLSRKGGPIASFLFVGPTGVGKTELAKILAEIQFGSRDFMIRFDMSEYQDVASVAKLIGTPDGKKSGALTESVLKNPYSLVLLDEFEKAHPDILNLFLQVFDDGRLTDNLGHVVDFQNTVIIATSNAGSDFIKEELERGVRIEDFSGEIKKRLTQFFRPELINRFSDVVVFRDLTSQEIIVVAEFIIKDLIVSLRESQGIDLHVDERAVRKIAEIGFNPVFGARPLRQAVSEKIRSALAEKILRREVRRGTSLTLSYENEQFVWKNEEDR